MFPVNIPNCLTVLRILLVPVLVVVLLEEMPEGSLIAAALFVGVALTDGLDGYIARARHDETSFGKVMDPVADKLLIAAALIVLVSGNRLAAWVAMVVIAREFAVSALRVAANQRGVAIPSSWLGKWKTTIQIAAITALIAAPQAGAGWVRALTYAMVAITVVSGLDYFLNWRRGAEEAQEKVAERGLAPQRST